MKEAEDLATSQETGGEQVSKPVTRRRFMGCAAVAATAVVGYAGISTGTQAVLKRSGETTQATRNQQALKQLLLRSQQGPSGRRFPVLDIHCHPSLKAYMFRQRFWKTHEAKPGMSPTSLAVDIDSLVNGGAGAFLCCAYALERQFFSDVLPLRALSKLHPRPHHMATAPLNVLAMEHLDKAEEMVAEANRERGDIIEVAKSYSDIGRIVDAGKICMLHSMEGAHHLAGNLELVDDFFERGVCMMTVPHLYPNEAGGCLDFFSPLRKLSWTKGSFSKKYQDNSGLSPWGHELVEKLLDVGIVVDIIHGPPDYRRQIIDIAKNDPKKRPVTMSHVSIAENPAEALAGPSPQEVRAIADMGGAIGLMMVRHRYKTAQAPVEAMLHAVDYLVQHGGEDVVAVGSDFDGYAPTPEGLASPRDFGAVRGALLGKYTEEQTAKFLFGNSERLLRMGWGRL